MYARGLAEVLQRARAHGSEKLFVLGGAQVYAQALPLVDEMILTHLPIEVEGDAYFPALGRRRMGGGGKAQRRRVGLCDVSPLLRRCINPVLWGLIIRMGGVYSPL